MRISFRPATADDLELMMAWRSHPLLYQNFYIQDEPLDWEGHIDWWEGREDRRDWIIVINEGERWRDVGNVNVSNLDTEYPEIGMYVGEVTAWGKGIATEAVSFALSWLADGDYVKARARVLNHNDASQRVFEKLGFEHTGSAREEEKEYVIELRGSDR